MAKRDFYAGAVDQTIDVFIQSAAVTNGAGLTGLTTNSAGLVCIYRKGATGATNSLTLVTQTVTGAHTDGGFIEVHATNMPGLYRLDLSDTIVAATPYAIIMLHGAASMVPCVVELDIKDPAGTVAANITHIGGTAYTTAQLTNTTRLDAAITTRFASNDASITNLGSVPALLTASTNSATLALFKDGSNTIRADITHVGQTAYTTVQLTNISRVDVASSTLATAANLATVAGYLDTEIAAIQAAVDTEVAAIKAVTDAIGATAATNMANLDATISSRVASNLAGLTNLAFLDVAVSSRVAGSLAGLTNLTFLDVAVSSRVASNLAGLTNLANLDAASSAIKAKADNLPSDPADASDIAGAFSTVNSTLATLAAYVDTEVAAIKVVTDAIGATAATNMANLNATVTSRLAGTASISTSIDAQQVREAMLLGTTNTAAVGSIDYKLDNLAAGAGSGAYTIQTIVNDGATALQNAKVRFSEGSNTFLVNTSATGGAQFNLNAATYEIAVTKDGYTYAGTTRAITGSLTGTNKITLSMTAIVISASTNAAETNGYLYCYDENNDLESGVNFRIVMQAGPGSEAASYPRDAVTVASGTSGLVQVGLRLSSSFTIQREKSSGVWGPPVRFVTGTSATQALPEVLGRAS